MNTMTLTLWLMTGTFIGGVVTPVVTRDRKISDWLSMLLGVIVGAIGNVVLLIPAWLGLSYLVPRSEDNRTPWQRDAISLEESKTAVEQSLRPHQLPLSLFLTNLWPAARQDGHSHRMTYVGVFVALAIITAVEVLITVIDLGFSTTGLLVALSSAKVALVAMFFMHLRYDSKWYSSIFVYAAPFAALIVIVLAYA